ncbi:MAG: hypothetical protein KDA69_13325 [Planctomycetaceae bacterium]|nr:hypothetical protein [Planctomycetaceae bacterium]
MVLQKFKAHKFRGSKEFDDNQCAYCGLPEATDYCSTDDSVEDYPFQVQHTDVLYAVHDLETFPQREVNPPTPEDEDRLGKLLEAIRKLPATAQLADLNKSISKVIKSNKHERMILLETFGYAGILCSKSKHHYGKKFVTFDAANSDQPKEVFKQEWEYPVRFWTGKDGVNETVVQSLFGDCLPG